MAKINTGEFEPLILNDSLDITDRFKLIDKEEGILQYTGKVPVSVKIEFDTGLIIKELTVEKVNQILDIIQEDKQ